MFLDESTARLVKAGLECLPKDAAVEGMLFDLDEWLEATHEVGEVVEGTAEVPGPLVAGRVRSGDL